MEQSPPSPPSPPVYLDLPQKPNGSSSEGWHHVPNDMMLPYISRMLLEDDIDSKLNDHPAILQVQQPFAQILSSPSSGTNTGNTEGANDLLQDDGGRDESTLNQLVLSSGTNMAQAFTKGMEEASMFLPPKGKNFQSNKQVSQVVRDSCNRTRVKKRYNEEDHIEEDVGRTSKAVMMTKEPEEENCANEMLDEIMSHAYDTCIRGIGNLRVVATDNEAEKKRSSRSKAAKDHVVDVRTLLISCAQAVASNNHMGARELLQQIKKHASATGDATQRLAQCFTKGLEARLMGSGRQLWQLIMADRPSVVEFLKVHNLYWAACCFNKVAVSFSTMTIMEAMVGKSRLHIVDYGMHFGFQWAGLLQWLASSREGGLPLPEVKITAIGRPKRNSCAAMQMEEIEFRLRKRANDFGLPSFKFHKIMKKWEDVSIQDLNTEADEVLVVSDLFNLSTLMDESGYFQDPSPRDAVLGNIKKMRPDVFIQSILNRSCGTSFLPRFREVLYYYMALFDMLDATMPRESKSRLVLEQVVFGRSALNAIACEGLDRVDRPEKYRQWQARNQRAGLRQLPLKPRIIGAVKDMVLNHHHKDFLICEDGQWLLQGWRGRILFAHSTWVAQDASSR
ncbi:hypothetical protein BS78_K259500 [Paspalum vaginatum]|uniref:GRAS family transcription factor n=1 Tax=Paspalum vaginatum TaxID=158149 RepID=A0A9W7XBG8_9POAL|nr:hypothetical protein BS78_K259500 [Paspalum vaginatum]